LRYSNLELARLDLLKRDEALPPPREPQPLEML
jgi:hypothetical protein